MKAISKVVLNFLNNAQRIAGLFDIEFSLKLSSNSLKFLRKLLEISTEIRIKFIQKVFSVSSRPLSHFFEDFQIFFSFFPNVTQIFLTFSFLQNFSKFSKNYTKVFLYSKILQKNSKYSTFSIFFLNFFTNDNKLKLHYNICKVPSRKLEVFSKFH